jgi:hypothetical protein
MKTRRWFLGAAAAAFAALFLRKRRSEKREIRIPSARLDRSRLREPHDLVG